MGDERLGRRLVLGGRFMVCAGDIFLVFTQDGLRGDPVGQQRNAQPASRRRTLPPTAASTALDPVLAVSRGAEDNCGPCDAQLFMWTMMARRRPCCRQLRRFCDAFFKVTHWRVFGPKI